MAALYRNARVGVALSAVLDDLVQEGIISPGVASKVLAQFDRSVIDTLAGTVKASATIKACL